MLPVIPTITKHLFKRQHKAHEWKPNAFQVPTGRPYVHAWPGSNGTDSTEYWREGAFRNAETALVSQRTSFPSSVKRTEYFKFVCLFFLLAALHSIWDLSSLFSSVQFSRSVVSDSSQSHGLQHARLPCPSPIPGVYSKLMSIESVMPSNHLILCHPILLLPSIFPSIRVFSSESVLYIRWPKYWSFSFSISPSSEYSRLISFRMDWLDLLAVQGTLKSLLQHHSSKASILWHSAFFIVQLSHPYMTTGKTIALTRWTFVGKGMSLLFNMLSRLVIAFLPRSRHLLTSWLQSQSACPPK